MTHSTRILTAFLMLICNMLGTAEKIHAEEKFGPDDPLAAIDGNPIFLGELNLMLQPMARGRSINELSIDIQQAAAVVLVRRHLAMRSLRQKGGEAVDDAINRYAAQKTNSIERTGSNLEAVAINSMANKESLLRSWAWEAAWNLYIKSRLTSQNLRRFHEQNSQVGDPKFDELTDHAKLRRNATNALFNALVTPQANAKIQWFIPALRPPADVLTVPSAAMDANSESFAPLTEDPLTKDPLTKNPVTKDPLTKDPAQNSPYTKDQP